MEVLFSEFYNNTLFLSYMSLKQEINEAQEAVFTIDISKTIGPEYIMMMEDIARFVAIQTIIQLLLYTMDSQLFPFFSTDFLLLLLFISIGVMFYHLVLKKIVAFK